MSIRWLSENIDGSYTEYSEGDETKLESTHNCELVEKFYDLSQSKKLCRWSSNTSKMS